MIRVRRQQRRASAKARSRQKDHRPPRT
jgi:hypothetical protein